MDRAEAAAAALNMSTTPFIGTAFGFSWNTPANVAGVVQSWKFLLLLSLLALARQSAAAMSEADESDKSIPYFFPDECPVRFTLQVFPHSGMLSAGLATDTVGSTLFSCFRCLVASESLTWCDSSTCPVHNRARGFLLAMHEVLVEESQDNIFLAQRSGNRYIASNRGRRVVFLPLSILLVGVVHTATALRLYIQRCCFRTLPLWGRSFRSFAR